MTPAPLSRRGRRSSSTRPLALGAVLAVAALVTAACGSSSETPGSTSSASESASQSAVAGTVKVWGHQGEAGEVTALQAAVDSFNSSQSNIKVELQLIPGEDYTKTIQATSGDKLPDILEYDGPLMSSFVYDGKLKPITGLVADATIANQTNSVKAQNTYSDGQLYGVSMFDSGLGIYGNKKLLDAAGVKYPTGLSDAWTADQFEAALKQLAASDKDGKVLDIKENYGGEWPTYGFLPIVSSAGHVVVQDGKAEGNLNAPEVVAAVQKFASWRDLVDPNADDKAFVDGRVALSWVGHWLYNPYAEAMKDDLVVLPLPDFGTGPKTGQGSWAWGIGATTQNGAAAGAFLDYLLNDTNVAAMTTANGAPPGTTSVTAASTLYKPDGALALFAEQLAATCGTGAPTKECVAVPRPITPAYPVISQKFSEAFFNAYNGGDAKAELDKAAAAIDQDYADNGGYAG